MDVIIDIYGSFHLRTPEYIFFSSAHGTLSRIDPILGLNTTLNKFKKIEIIPSIFSDHDGLKMEIKCKKKCVEIK